MGLNRRPAPPVDGLVASNSTIAFGTGIVGDTVDRLVVQGGGALNWGSGSGAADVVLSRNAAGILNAPALLTTGIRDTANTKSRIVSNTSGVCWDVSNVGGSTNIVWRLVGVAAQSGDYVVINNSSSVAQFRILSTGKLALSEAANGPQGVVTLVGGTATVSNTNVTANSRIFLTAQSLGTVAVASALAITARVAGTSFTITASVATDTSVVAYEIVEPA